MAKPTGIDLTQIEYTNVTEKRLETQDFDVIEFLNEKGKDGWMLINATFSKEPTTLTTIGGPQVEMIVANFFMQRFVRIEK